MKNTRRAICAFLALLICLSLLPGAAFAAEEVAPSETAAESAVPEAVEPEPIPEDPPDAVDVPAAEEYSGEAVSAEDPETAVPDESPAEDTVPAAEETGTDDALIEEDPALDETEPADAVLPSDEAEAPPAAAAETGAEMAPEEADTEGAVGLLGESLTPDQAEAAAGEYLEHTQLWENSALMKSADEREDSLNTDLRQYDSGYVFFDIDLDGARELAVQLGGDNIDGCTTLFYSLRSSVPEQMYIFEDSFSLSVEDLALYAGEGERGYIHLYTVLDEASGELTTIWGRLILDEQTGLYREEELLRASSDGKYYVNYIESDFDGFEQARLSLMSGFEAERELVFIRWEDWQEMDSQGRLRAMAESLAAR